MPIPIDPSPINPHVHERGWHKSPIPQILENIPDNLTLNRKLQQILSWSLQRPEDQVLQTKSGLTFADNIGEAVPTKPHTDQSETNYTSDLPVTDGSDASSTTFSPKSNTAGGFRSRLKQIRQDIATKIASKDQGKARVTDDYASTGSNEVAENRECISCFDEFMKDNLVMPESNGSDGDDK
ncbi:hypothetical protein LTS08_001796 [Lithohypha guttulata]|uniref:Uncharacterized protein n=1 Tax=Lithohypha guttulata TaxID=1690604 RepID=A0AAN7SUK5_9EURO|nr:hypothetical protein LTR51_003521 [Lithohypha guttulata]KAK5082026.1 hypothetical protein LTR05_007168 [Lithohypha guttulata]KAK5105519.1 hypothetical protein LTS08_001796 [Lithohypha guttulata]